MLRLLAAAAASIASVTPDTPAAAARTSARRASATSSSVALPPACATAKCSRIFTFCKGAEAALVASAPSTCCNPGMGGTNQVVCL